MVTTISILGTQDKVFIFDIRETVHVLSNQNNDNQTFSTRWPRQEEIQRKKLIFLSVNPEQCTSLINF